MSPQRHPHALAALFYPRPSRRSLTPQRAGLNRGSAGGPRVGTYAWILPLLACAILAAPLPDARAQDAVGELKAAQALLASGNFKAAFDAFTKVIAQVPQQSQAYQGRGQARAGLKDFAGAIQDYDQAITLSPKTAVLFNLRGNAKNDNGDSLGAMIDYNHAITLDPRYPAPLSNRAALRIKQGDLDGAMADYDHALAIAPKHAFALSARGNLKASRGDNAGAAADFTALIEVSPKNAHAFLNRGLAREKLGNTVGALEDFRGCLALDPKMAAAKTRIAALENSSVPGTSPVGQPIPSRKEVSSAGAGVTPATGSSGPTGSTSGLKPVAQKSSGPVQAFDSSSGSRVLAPFTGYAVSDPCAQPQTLPGAPWRSEKPAVGGAVAAAQLGQYQAMVRHTMNSLRILYGQLTPAEEKSFNAFWAPFFDHPTPEAVAYFQQITPLLDDMTVSLANLEGMLPGMGEALQGTMMEGGDPKSGAACVAAAQYQRVKAERVRLAELSAKISALGNPPNPLAAKCAARQRHRKAVLKEVDVVALVKAARLISYYAYQVPKTITWVVDGDERNTSKDYGSKITEWSWEGNTFKYAEQNAGEVFNYDSPRQATSGGDRYEITGTLSPDGKTLEHLRCVTLNRYYHFGLKKVMGPRVDSELELVNIPLSSVTVKPDWSEVTFAIKGAAVAKCIAKLNSDVTWDAHKDNEVTITFQVGNRPADPEEMKRAAAAIQNLMAGLNGTAATTAAKKEDAGASTAASDAAASAKTKQSGAAESHDLDPENDPKVNAEAIAEHVALAEQTRRDADRWAADAAKEKDPDRRKELQDRATGMYDNAQSEKDIAESLRTGTLVHTRTDWDEQQHQALVGSIKQELAAFDAENKLIANIPKVADMVGGVEGVNLRDQIQGEISDAIHSPDAVRKLAAIYGKLQDKVIDQGQQQINAEQDKVEMWDRRIAIAQDVEMAAGMTITLGALWAPAEMGSLALGYAGSTGFAEGGVKGATVAVVRGVSSRADIIISAYEGATKIDPATGQPAGAWGAVEGALWSIGTNKAFEVIGGRIQQAKAEYALARQAAGGPGFAPVARAGEGKIKEFDFQTPEQRYKNELEMAKTPEDQASASRKYAIQEQREAMGAEKEAARQRAEDAVRKGTTPETAKEQYNQDLRSIDQKFAAKETRNQEHQEVMKELGFDTSYDKNNTDIKPTGSNPKTAESDMDFAPVGNTPHEAYQKGKAYTEALKKRGHNIDEYGDRWVDTTNDATIWKPGFGADKPGSSSFDAEVIFGTLPNSDKFGTKGGVEWTTTGSTPDPLGAVLANTGKAVGAGLGNSRPPDLHVIGKSATKALDILAGEKIPIEVDPTLGAQMKALKEHQTPEQAGVVDIGADPATKDRQVKSFMDKVQTLMGKAIALAGARSDENVKALEQSAASSAPDQAYKVRAQAKAYQAGNKAALETIVQVSPGLAAEVGRSAKPTDPVLSGPALNLNVGGLTRALAQDRDSDAHAPPPSADSSDPVFSDLGKRCKQAAQAAGTKLAAAKPGSDEARYLTDLKAALEQGGKNPAEAVRAVRNLSGTELPVVLAQLGAPAK